MLAAKASPVSPAFVRNSTTCGSAASGESFDGCCSAARAACAAKRQAATAKRRMVAFMVSDVSTVGREQVVRDQLAGSAWAVSPPPAGFSLAWIFGMITRPFSADGLEGYSNSNCSHLS